MWLCFNDAFVSVVKDRRSDCLVVRARSFEHLARLFPRDRIVETPDADYGWRVFATRDEIADIFARRIRTIDYTNFKNSVREPMLKRLYERFWLDHFNYQRLRQASRSERRARRA